MEPNVNQAAKHSIIILVAALAAVILALMTVQPASAHEPDCALEHRFPKNNPVGECDHMVESLRDAPTPTFEVRELPGVEACAPYIVFKVDQAFAHPSHGGQADDRLFVSKLHGNRVSYETISTGGRRGDPYKAFNDQTVFNEKKEEIAFRTGYPYRYRVRGNWRQYGLKSTLPGTNPFEDNAEWGWTGRVHVGDDIGIGRLRWQWPDSSAFLTQLNQCLLDMDQRIKSEAALKRAAEEKAAAELEAAREEARRQQVAADQAAEIAAANEVAKAEAEANIAKARSLTEKLEGERKVLAAWHEVEKIRQQGRVKRAGIINQHLVLIEADAAAWELEMQEMAAEVKRLQRLNAAIVQGLAYRQSWIATEIEVQRTLEQQALDALDELVEDSASATPEPGVSVTPEPGATTIPPTPTPMP